MIDLPSTENRGEAIHYALQKLQQVKGTQIMSILAMGKILKWVRDEKLWQGQWESFDNHENHNFLTEVGFEKSTANAYIKVFEKFGHLSEGLLSELHWTKLQIVAPVVKSPEQAEEWAEKVKELTSTDLRKELAQYRSGTDPDACSHDDRIIRQCKVCHRKVVES